MTEFTYNLDLYLCLLYCYYYYYVTNYLLIPAILLFYLVISFNNLLVFHDSPNIFLSPDFFLRENKNN